MFGNSRSLFGGDFTRRLRHLGLAVCLGVPVGVATAVVSDGAAFAAIHTVMNCDNSGAGSLRGAVGAASPGDTIEFSSTATCSSATPITLSSTISITKNLTIQGPGANNLFVSGNNSVDVFSIASGKKVTISTLTIEDGPLLGTSISNSGTLTLKNSNVSGSDGDGVDNSGTLNVIDSTISGNAAGIFTDAGTVNVTNNTLSDNGEGISSSGGTTNVTDSTLSGNGDGVLPEGGTTNVTDSTLSGNDNGIFTDAGTVNVTTSTLSDSDEDGVFTTGGTTNVNRSTFSGNSTGIFTDGGTVSLGTSTVSGNYQYGIAADAGTTNVTNSTLSDDDNGTFNGGGTVNLTATILGDDAGGDCSGGVTDEGYNIDDDSSCTFSATGSVNDSPTLDSHLGPLAYNGGPTQTIAILSGSPAIDKVPAIDCPATDQRGVARTAPCDIGAYDTDGNGEFPYLTVSGPPSATRWSPFQVTVTALNANGTIDKGFSGTVSFTSTDSSAVLPASKTLTDGTGTFSVTFETAGSETLTATSPPLASGSQTLAVGNPVLALTTPADVTSGKNFTFSVRALNPNGTIDTGYPNMVDFSLANGSSTWTAPGPSKLTSGKKTFTTKLTGAGPQMIVATDSVDSSITTTSNAIEVG